ncbi:MAG: MFS transporter, partial [Clostridia bacterium]|nr:MFS transporter [Clostridia bacterium]
MMQKKQITNKVLWIFAVGQFGWSLLSGIISTWLVHLYTGAPEKFGDTNGLFADFISQHALLAGLTLFGIITAVGRLFDAITDPLIASWSDKANFKGGRRIPFMKWVAIPFAAVTVAVFIVPQFSNVVVNDILIFVLLMLFYLFMTIYCTPYNALIAELGDTQAHRINVSTYISFTYIAGFSLSTLIPSLAGMFQGSKISDILSQVAAGNSLTLETLNEKLADKTIILKDIASEQFDQIKSIQQQSFYFAIGIMAIVACIAMLIPSLYIKERAYIDSKP